MGAIARTPASAHPQGAANLTSEAQTMTQTSAPRFDAATAAQVAAFLDSRPADDPQRQDAERQVFASAAKRMDDEARALLRFIQRVDRAAAVRLALKALQD